MFLKCFQLKKKRLNEPSPTLFFFFFLENDDERPASMEELREIEGGEQGLQDRVLKYSQATPKNELTNGKCFTFNHGTGSVIACQTIRLDLADLLG